MMLATHITPFTPIARDGHSEAETVTSSYKTAAKSRNTGTIRARIAVRGVAVGLDRRRATQVAAIAKTRLSAHFVSKRHVLRADRITHPLDPGPISVVCALLLHLRPFAAFCYKADNYFYALSAINSCQEKLNRAG